MDLNEDRDIPWWMELLFLLVYTGFVLLMIKLVLSLLGGTYVAEF
jgi:hypothetical protein